MLDALLTSVLGAAPQLGGATLLVVVLLILIKREVQTTARHGVELERVTRLHDTEMTEKDAEIRALRERADRLQVRLDEEMDLRRAAQDSRGGARHRLA